jgi:hypothetical protein
MTSFVQTLNTISVHKFLSEWSVACVFLILNGWRGDTDRPSRHFLAIPLSPGFALCHSVSRVVPTTYTLSAAIAASTTQSSPCFTLPPSAAYIISPAKTSFLLNTLRHKTQNHTSSSIDATLMPQHQLRSNSHLQILGQ